MNILVTGADGLLGSNLVRLLINRGHDISVFLHPSSKSTTLNGLNIKRFTGDILDIKSIESVIEGVEYIIHVAAITNIWPSRSEYVNKVNIEGTQNMIDLALKHKIKRFIYIGSASSVNAEGDSNDGSFPGAKFGLDYIDSKYHALNLIIKATNDRELPAIAILPTYMIGPYDSLPSSGKMILAISKGKLKFYSGGGRNVVSVNDVAIAIANSLTMGQIGKFYVAGGENLTYKSLFYKVSKTVGQKEPKIKIPNFAIKSIGHLGSFIGNTFKIEPMISYPMALISCEKQFTISTDAIAELEMPQTPIEEAIGECYNWFKANGYCE